MNLSNYRIVAAGIGLALLTSIPALAAEQTSFQKQYKVIEQQPIASTRIFIKAKKQPTVSIQQNYAEALSTANRFLSAWRGRNYDEGITLLSRKLKSRLDLDDLRTYISGTSNPHHTAFEVGVGQKLRDGRFAFQVKLYECVTGEPTCQMNSKRSRIVLVKEGSDNWLVDELP